MISPELFGYANKVHLLTQKLNELIREYLKTKNDQYDTQDLDRALRQAATTCDIEAVKILVFTYRANIN